MAHGHRGQGVHRPRRAMVGTSVPVIRSVFLYAAISTASAGIFRNRRSGLKNFQKKTSEFTS